MSIYYNPNQNYSPAKPTTLKHSKSKDNHTSPISQIQDGLLNKSRQLRNDMNNERPQFINNRSRQIQEEWEDIAQVNRKKSLPKPAPKKQENPGKQQPLKRKAKKEVKDKLAFIVNYFEQEHSAAQVTHYHQVSENEDQLQRSASTVQSNDRRRYKSVPRKQGGTRTRLKGGPQGSSVLKNRQGKAQNRLERDELEMQQQMKKEVKAGSKYLFYNVIKEQRHKGETNEPKPAEANKIRNVTKQQHNSFKRQLNVIFLDNEPSYEYQKGAHPPKEQKKKRLKNKIGCIFDIFQQKDQVASVSYYSESQKESMQIIPKDQQIAPQTIKQKQPPIQNVFYQQERIEEEQVVDRRKDLQFQSPTKSRQQQTIKSRQFQTLNIPVSPIQKIEYHEPTSPNIIYNDSKNESPFMKIKKSIKINSSLEKVQLQQVHINRNRSKSRLSATKSVQNKPKVSRYAAEVNEDLQNEQARPKKQSADLRDLSRHIKETINKQSSDKPSRESMNNENLEKSKSVESKFSIKLVEMQLRKSQDNKPKQFSSQEKAKSIQMQKSASQRQKSSKSRKQEEAFEEDTTVKKIFPIARKVSFTKNNNNLSKYMKINFKDDGSNHQDDINQEVPNIMLKKTDHIQGSRPQQLKNKQTIKINTNANTIDVTSKISFKPVNKIDFNIDRAKRFKTEFIQPKDQLSDQQKKFLALLRKRQDALLKRVKEQVQINNPSIFLRDNFEQTKEISNQTFQKLASKEESNSSGKNPVNYYHAERRDKMSLKSQKIKQIEVKSYFPTLNLSPSGKEQNLQTFYNPIKRNNSKNGNYITTKKKGLSEHLSSDSQRGKTDDRLEEVNNSKKQPSKISYYNIKKLQKESSLNQKNLNSKEKYERLKQLLEQI